MRYKFLFFICLAFLLTACSNVQQEASDNEEQLTQELIQLFHEKKYDEITDKVVKQKIELEKNFFNIALAYKELEKTGIGKRDSLAKSDQYEYIKAKLDNVNNPPSEIAEEINRTKRIVEQKYITFLKEEKPNEYDASVGTLPNPSIGMTKEEVLYSTWGKPKDINKTTTADTVSEQWVYSDYKYLYFENGILTTIQE